MIKLKTFLILFFLTSFLTACSKEDNGSDPILLKIASGLNKDNSINVGPDVMSASFSVYASATPTVSSNSGWVKATANTPNSLNNVSKIDLIIEPNQDTENSRTAVITVTLGQQSLQVTLNQEKAETPLLPDEGDDDQKKEHKPWINPEACEIDGLNAREVALSLGVGWNLGNQMDAFNNGISSETAWGNPVATQSLFDTLKSKGFSTVRIPVTWLGHIGDAPDYKIDESWLARVRELVEMAETAGLNAIVNIHHDGADSKHWLNIKDAALNSELNEEIKKEIYAVWSQIAASMKDKGNFLMFEAFNEIHDGGWGWGANRTDGGKQYNCLNEWNQTFVDAVRSTGGNNGTRWLSVPSYVTNIDLAVNGSMILPKDEAGKVMVSVHFYDPNDFALNSIVTDWGHTGEKSNKGSVVQDEEYILSQFNKLTKYWVENSVPVYIGESGPSNNKNARGNAFRNYYLEYMHRAAKDAGLAVIYWDNGAVGSGTDKFGLFHHGNGNILNNGEEAINAMLRGGTCRDEDYNLQYIYDNAPVF